MSQNGTLSPKKKKAVLALLSGADPVAAADVAGVAKRTIYRWLQEADFRTALAEAESEAVRTAARKLAGLQAESIQVIASVMRNEENTPGVRLRAAGQILDFSLRLRDKLNFEQRLADVESILNLR